MRKKINLNFDWYFSNYKDVYINDYKTVEKFTKVDIPHNMVDLNYNYNNPQDLQIVGIYRRVIKILDEYKGKILKLVFSGVAHKTQIFINGNYVTSHFGGYDEFSVDISEFVNYGEENYLSVVVSAKEDENIPPFGGKLDFLGYGGIYREVSLIILNQNYIKESYLRLHNFKKKSIAFSCFTTEKQGLLRLKLIKDNEVFEKDFEVTDYANNYTFTFENLEYWDLDNPVLYNVELEYLINDDVVDTLAYKTGFRELVFTRKGFFLNEKQVKLIGLSRHQSFPYVGYAMPKSVQEKDAEILKYELGLNIVRCTSYLHSSHFLNRCDEIGLLVFSEIPGYNYIGGDDFKNNTLKNVETMIKRDYHHPSIILWSVRISESFDDDLYIKTNKIAKMLDSSRPTTGVRNYLSKKIYEDVYSFNDFYPNKSILTKPKKIKYPFLVSGHTGHSYPIKNTDNEEVLIKHALKHLSVIEKAINQKNILGIIGSSFTDYHTHNGFGSEDLINYHGVMDMFRLPKYTASIYKLLTSSEAFIDVLSSFKPGEYSYRYLPKIYVATNAEYIKLYRDNKLVGNFYPKNKSPLRHSLIVIDDYLGDILVREEKISKSSNRIIKKLFSIISQNGFNLKFFDRIKLYYILRRNNLTIKDFEKLYYKYAIFDATFRFDGIIKGVVATTKTISSLKKTTYEVTFDKQELVHDETYDATRVVIKKIDQDGNILRYAKDTVTVSVNKNLEVLGKSSFSLSNGMAAFWIRSKANNTLGEIKIKIGDDEYAKIIKIR